MLDVLIKNANIIDGTGKPAYKGSIGISGGKLVMADGSEEATAVIDASGKYVSPGWIDAHSHGDLILGSEDAHLFKTTQGVTTELTGQCGLSMAPVMPENLAAVQNMLSMGTTWFPDDMKLEQLRTFPRLRRPAEAHGKRQDVHRPQQPTHRRDGHGQPPRNRCGA